MEHQRSFAIMYHPVFRVIMTWIWAILAPLLCAVIVVFAYGPLEVFFVTWLITNTDRIFKSENARVSWGLIVTVLLFGLLHILVTQSLANALHVAVTFFLLGLIYKYTGNSIGPMAAWTLINGQVWFLAQLLWSL